MFLRHNMGVSVPVSIQFITSKKALTIMDQRQIGGMEMIVAINLYEQIGRNEKTRFEQMQGLFEHDQIGKILAPFEFDLQIGMQISDRHAFLSALSRLISACISAIPVTANSQSK